MDIDIDKEIFENIDIVMDKEILENINININKETLENIDIDSDIKKEILENIDININIDRETLENIDIGKDFLENIDIDEILNRLEFGISNRASLEGKILLYLNNFIAVVIFAKDAYVFFNYFAAKPFLILQILKEN